MSRESTSILVPYTDRHTYPPRGLSIEMPTKLVFDTASRMASCSISDLADWSLWKLSFDILKGRGGNSGTSMDLSSVRSTPGWISPIVRSSNGSTFRFRFRKRWSYGRLFACLAQTLSR